MTVLENYAVSPRFGFEPRDVGDATLSKKKIRPENYDQFTIFSRLAGLVIRDDDNTASDLSGAPAQMD